MWLQVGEHVSVQDTSLIEAARSYGWRISPLAAAIRFSSLEGEAFEAARHLKIISDAIVDAKYGLGPRFLAISMPPRHGKSWMISRRTPEWYLANWPDKKVMVVGYGSDFAQDWGRLIRNDLAKHEGITGVRIAKDSKAADKWHTTKGGILKTAGIQADILGFGADLLVIDDPVKNWKEANSLAYRDHAFNAWESQLRSRLEPGAIVIIVMQRWHEDDLIGRVLSREGRDAWREIRLPALADNKNCPDLLGRKDGEALWPNRFDEAAILDLQRDQSDDTFASMYQQMPASMLKLGRVYSSFSEDNIAKTERDSRLPLLWCLDFNVDPMTSVLCQAREAGGLYASVSNDRLISLEVLDEISLANSDIQKMCEAFDKKVNMMQGTGSFLEVHLYGDSSGNHRQQNGGPSCWQSVFQHLSQNKRYKIHDFRSNKDPYIKDRVNAVNAVLKNAAGERRAKIHPQCTGLITDMKEVQWKRDPVGNTTGQFEKQKKGLTHLSDAWGYMVEKKYGIKGTIGERSGTIT